MAPVAPSVSAASERSAQAPLRIFYGRLSVALLGCLAVLTVVVGAPLAMFTPVSGLLPLFALLAALGSFSTLRGLAVRDRRAKLLARLESTRALAMETGRTPAAEPVKKATTVFDAQPDSNKRAPRLSVEELRAEALRIAHKGAAVQRPEGWEPTEIPLPGYVVANAVKRPTPAPLPAAVAPQASSSQSLRAREAAARLAEATGTLEGAFADEALPAVPALPVHPAASDSSPEAAPSVASAPSTVAKPAPGKPNAPAAAGRINLDDVMQRRRA